MLGYSATHAVRPANALRQRIRLFVNLRATVCDYACNGDLSLAKPYPIIHGRPPIIRVNPLTVETFFFFLFHTKKRKKLQHNSFLYLSYSSSFSYVNTFETLPTYANLFKKKKKMIKCKRNALRRQGIETYVGVGR